jgi:hypothetical protein
MHDREVTTLERLVFQNNEERILAAMQMMRSAAETLETKNARLSRLPLIVDLDGTLIRSNLLVERFFAWPVPHCQPSRSALRWCTA